jgi:hypothetical protein
VEKLKGDHDSIPRNPLIAKAFFWIKFSEEVGSGTSKIIQWCKEWGLPEPTYEEAGGSFVTVFHNPKPEETVSKDFAQGDPVGWSEKVGRRVGRKSAQIPCPYQRESESVQERIIEQGRH